MLNDLQSNRFSYDVRPMSADSQSKLLYLLKAKGPSSTTDLAQRLAMTAVGARQHLAKLREDGLVRHADRAGQVGRPRRIWALTARGHARFPDTHGELTAGLIDGVRRLFGAAGLDRLIRERAAETLQGYRAELKRHAALGARVRALAKLRSAEGYMAEVAAQTDGSFLLIENHCPICIAAKACQGFCRAEAETFTAAFGAGVAVERQEHLLSGGRRCVYRVTLSPAPLERGAERSEAGRGGRR
jgi:predicted ArsR family transcriptional regulator